MWSALSRNKYLHPIAWLLLLAACASPRPEEAKVEPLYALNPDTTIRPASDFYRFANNAWLQTTTVPTGYRGWTIYHELERTNRQQLMEIVQSIPNNPRYPEGSGIRKAWHFFQAGLDSLRIERQGLAPLRAMLNTITAIRSTPDLMNYLKDDYSWVPPFFQCVPTGDGRATLVPSGLGLTELQDYVATNAETRIRRQQYVDMMATLFRLSGQSEGAAQADAWEVLEVETTLARAWLQTDEVPRSYFQWAELDRLSPDFPWSAWRTSASLPAEWVFTSRTQIEALNRIWAMPIEKIKSYLKGQLSRKAAPYLSSGFQQAYHDFYPPNNTDIAHTHRVLRVVNELFSDAIGKVYVRQYFSTDSLRMVQALAENTRLAMADRIKALPIPDSLKVRPLSKLRQLKINVGFPDKWKSYAGLLLEKDSARQSWVGYIMQARKFQHQEMWRPIAAGEWSTPAQSTQLVYEANHHTLTIPAGFLQHPMWHPRAAIAVQYGLTGVLMAQAMVPLFQDLFHAALLPAPRPGQRGVRQPDEDENFLRWEQESAALHVALEGLMRYERENPGEAAPARWTSEQQFFIAWATLLRTQTSGQHQESIGNEGLKPLYYCQAFYRAFDVQPGDPCFIVPEKRIAFW